MFFKIVELALNHGFLERNIFSKLNFEQYKLGPVGLHLLNNLETEWFYHFVINRDVTVFLNKEDFKSTFDFAKKMCCDRLPLGIVEKKGNSKKMNSNDLMQYYKSLEKSESIEFSNRFPEEEKQYLKGTFFISPTQSTKFFHQFQRQRRIWWRKISASPGRYLLTDIKTCENGSQNVEIHAKYPWGDQTIEKLVLNCGVKDLDSNQLQFKEGRKTVQPHTVSSTINLTTMFLNFLCDGFDEPLFQGKPRTILRFHRKLAPYRVSFAISGTNAASISELSDLALYLSRQLRTSHIASLLLPSASKLTLEAQYKQYDQLGVPYTAVLNENTLKDGILYLRSRDTTLKEQVHVTSLVTYVEQLCKNY